MKFKISILILLIGSILLGCTNQQKELSLDEVKKIKIELIEKETTKDGINYSIRLINGSSFTIKQNNMYLSYPIKIDGNGSQKENKYKVEADGNKLDIESGEEVILTVFMPYEGLGERGSLLINTPDVQLIGYLEKVDENHLFSKGGSLN